MTNRSTSDLLRAPLAAALLLLAACSSPKVFTNQDPDADFGNYRTYGFEPRLGTDDNQYSSLLSQYLKAAASRELEARGYRLADEPDLLVNFFLLSQEKIRTTSTPTGYYGYRGRGGYGAWGGYAGYETSVQQYTEGTLNVDLVDHDREQLVWEATLVGRVTDEVRKNLQQAIDQAMADVFQEYTFVAGSGVPGGPGGPGGPGDPAASDG